MSNEDPCRCSAIVELLGSEADQYATRHLRRTGSDETGWIVHFRCPNTGQSFVLDFPQSEYHGGGPARLRRAEHRNTPFERMNPTLHDLAVYMADYFSRDAADWPGRQGVPTDLPVRVTFRWFGSFVPAVGSELLDHLATTLRNSYRNKEETPAAVLVHEPSFENADAEIVLAEVPQDGAAGVAYEIRFVKSEEVYPGWFALPPV